MEPTEAQKLDFANLKTQQKEEEESEEESESTDSSDRTPTPKCGLELDIIEEDLIMQLKITLNHIRPKIWRRIQVSNKITFSVLHYYIQEAMGWLSCHQHFFKIDDVILVDEKNYDEYVEKRSEVVFKEHKVHLKEHFDYVGKSIKYNYAPKQDNWQHTVLFEKIVDNDDNDFPKCVEGKRACPPEDCGGIQGYYHLLEVLKNPKHEDHDKLIKKELNYTYPEYDPEVFNKDTVMLELKCCIS